jgi:hypothetical protein
MKCIYSQLVMCLSFLLSVAVVTGCEEKATVSLRPASPRPIGKLSPEESFELIVETFRRGIEDVKIGFRTTREGGHSMMHGKNEVTHKLIPPAREGEPYKGIITVNSESHYSLQRSTDRDDDSKTEEEEKDGDSQSGLDATGELGGTEILDSDLVGTSGGSGKGGRSQLPTGDEIVSRRPDQTERKYDLVYENGRWALVTKLDPELEQSIDYAFKHAFKQIN